MRACVLIAAMSLAGCATQTGIGPVSPSSDCPEAPISEGSAHCGLSFCPIPVQVSTGDDGKCEVRVGVSHLRLDRDNRGPVISWWMDESARNIWEFREESGPYTLPINFKDQNAPDLKNQISAARVLANGKKVQVTDQNTNKETYLYRIRVYKKGTNEYIESKDPALYNDF
jgi:hypothetical protein